MVIPIMRTLFVVLAVLALILAGCGKEEADTSGCGCGCGPDTTKMQEKPGDAMKTVKDTTSETIDFACNMASCSKTKTGTMASPPS